MLLPFPESRLRPESQHQHGLRPVFIADWAIVFKPLTHYTLTTDEVQVPTHKLQVNSLHTKTRSILLCNLLYLAYCYITCLSVNCVPLNNTVLSRTKRIFQLRAQYRLSCPHKETIGILYNVSFLYYMNCM